MRVLIVNKYAHVTGGADRHCLELAAALRSAGHEVAFLSTESPLNVEEQGRFIPLSVTHSERGGLDAGAQVGVAARAFWNPTAARATHELLTSFRPDVVHAHKLYPQLSVAPLIVAARRKLPIVQTLHDFELMSASAIDDRGRWRDRDETRPAFRLLNSGTYPVRRSIHRRCVSVSVVASRFMERRYAAHGISAVTIPHFTAPPSSGTATGFADREGIVYVGRLTREKGIDDVLELAALARQVPVTIVGDGPLRELVESRSRELPNLTYDGGKPGDEVMPIVQSARVLVVPSKWEEPAGLVALEAMAVGTPVVAYRRGGLAEYVGDAGGGRVIEESVAALHEAAAEIHDDSGLWEALSQRGRDAVATNHSADTYVRRIVDVYGAARELRAR